MLVPLPTSSIITICGCCWKGPYTLAVSTFILQASSWTLGTLLFAWENMFETSHVSPLSLLDTQ